MSGREEPRASRSSKARDGEAPGLPRTPAKRANTSSVQLHWIRLHRKRQLPLGALRTHEWRLPSRKPKKKKGGGRKRKRRDSGEPAPAAAPTPRPRLFAARAAALAPGRSPAAQPSDPAAARRCPPAGTSGAYPAPAAAAIRSGRFSWNFLRPRGWRRGDLGREAGRAGAWREAPPSPPGGPRAPFPAGRALEWGWGGEAPPRGQRSRARTRSPVLSDWLGGDSGGGRLQALGSLGPVRVRSRSAWRTWGSPAACGRA